jgi:hypothetical protein
MSNAKSICNEIENLYYDISILDEALMFGERPQTIAKQPVNGFLFQVPILQAVVLGRQARASYLADQIGLFDKSKANALNIVSELINKN